MHELSIALSMIETASEEVVRLGGGRVTALHLKIGPLSGVVKEALTFSYSIASQGTALEGSQLCIEEPPVIIGCDKCGDQVIESIQNLRCPQCDQLSYRIVQGKELEVVALELEEIGEPVR